MPGASSPSTVTRMFFGGARLQRLRRQHVFDFAGADAEGERAEGAVRRGVAVAADDRLAGQRQALLGTDDVDDALADVVHREIGDAEVLGVLFQGRDLERGFGIGDAFRAVGRGHVVVGDGERELRAADLAVGEAQAFEGLRARHLVHEMAVDVENGGLARFVVNQVGVPDFVVEGGWGHGVVT